MPQRRAVTSRSQEPRQRFAEEVRRLREERGVSLRQLAEQLGWDCSTLGKLERGQSLGSPEVAQALDAYYCTPGLLLALWELAVADPAQFKEQYRRYMLLESEATSLWHFGVNCVHGMFQTRGYARELIAAGGHQGATLDRQVEARLGRAALLGATEPPRFRTILYEAVLRMRLRDGQAWREQLEHLIESGDQSNIIVQVLPFSAGPFGLDSTEVTFLGLLGGRTVAYTENAHRGELIEEASSVERLELAYDSMRDLALSPAESRKFIGRILEEAPCDPST
ncbi:Scr1 family TA system antitoxin-like transcriptional regulator [Streptomyces sp. NPDC010273]|uniref:Scr1 family TA system antitoxin-like transcriptional regulator n=1 Tax=Streptomyces sp. NPDC010273 TaxID=3364829 RepID=UPI0036E50C64